MICNKYKKIVICTLQVPYYTTHFQYIAYKKQTQDAAKFSLEKGFTLGIRHTPNHINLSISNVTITSTQVSNQRYFSKAVKTIHSQQIKSTCPCAPHIGSVVLAEKRQLKYQLIKPHKRALPLLYVPTFSAVKQAKQIKVTTLKNIPTSAPTSTAHRTRGSNTNTTRPWACRQASSY